MTTQEQIDSFHRFATARLKNGGHDLTVDELYDQWRVENPSDEEFEENVAAIQASIDDMNRGERGRDAKLVIDELRAELNVGEAE